MSTPDEKVPITDFLSSAGYRVVHRFGQGIPDGCSIPLSLKSQEEKLKVVGRARRNSLRKDSLKVVNATSGVPITLNGNDDEEEAEEKIRQRYGQWNRRSVIASWVYAEAKDLGELVAKNKKKDHHSHHHHYRSLLGSFRRGFHFHRKNFKPKVSPHLLESHSEVRRDKDSHSLGSSSSSSNFSALSL